MPGLKKKPMHKSESSSSSYKDTMMKLKNYWPESTINLYLTKAISLHDLDSYVVSDEQMSDIHKVVLNMDEWYKKNPEYSFMTATKLLKEKAQIHMSMPSNRDTDDGSAISRYFRSESPYRSRTRYERAVEEDQYSRRNPISEEDLDNISDGDLDRMLAETAQIAFNPTETVNIPMPTSERPRGRTQTARVTYPSTSDSLASDRWSHLFNQPRTGEIETNPEPQLEITDVPSGHLMTGAVSDGILLHTPLGHIDGTVTDLALPVENFIQNEDGTWTRR